MFHMFRRHGFRIKSWSDVWLILLAGGLLFLFNFLLPKIFKDWSSKTVETMSVIFTVIALLVLTV